MGLLYCDDSVGVSNSTEDLAKLQIKLEQRLKEAKFEMHKWKSNDPYLREICATEEATTTKMLGIQRNTSKDSLSINFSHVVENEHSSNQRGILKAIASIFDPLGIGNLVTMLAKMFIMKYVSKARLGCTDIFRLAKLWDSWIKGIERHPELSSTIDVSLSI